MQDSSANGAVSRPDLTRVCLSPSQDSSGAIGLVEPEPRLLAVGAPVAQLAADSNHLQPSSTLQGQLAGVPELFSRTAEDAADS